MEKTIVMSLDIQSKIKKHLNGKINTNLNPTILESHILDQNIGVRTSTGAINILTGRFTGRSPEDRFIVEDNITRHLVDWGKINKPISTEKFNQLEAKILDHLQEKEIYEMDGSAGADDSYKINIKLFAENPYSALFFSNMFINNSANLDDRDSWTILCAPTFKADPNVDGTRQQNFAILNFSKKMVLIGGTGYTGEIKKSIFSALNFNLPIKERVLPMHCSANIGLQGDTALFFGLSGTGKTTLSADLERKLIGDDEHGWSDFGVFNFEGGCYAKCISLSQEKEPQIYNAIREGALLENCVMKEDGITPDFENDLITKNTRVSYPIDFIANAKEDSKGGIPSNIFFLTCDAFGILPPISKLSKEQAMYHFISGYTSKVAGTEDGINEPKATFSACFGAPFLPLHPSVYAEMLGQKIDKHKVNVWLINTGWTGGEYGQGQRIPLKYTRAMIQAVLGEELNDTAFLSYGAFRLKVPIAVSEVPNTLLDPRSTWSNPMEYDKKEELLSQLFIENFEQFKDKCEEEILEASPIILKSAV